jgi:hypothetical protein
VLVARRNMPTISSRATPNKERSLAWPMRKRRYGAPLRGFHVVD